MEDINSQESNSTKKNAFLSILLVAVFGASVMVPTYIWGMPVGADFDSHFRFALPFYDEIANGNFIPGWLAESNNGYGDARFRFYPPNLYYLICLFRYLSGDWYAATLIVFTIFSVIGALSVYFWTKRSLTNKTAVLAALLFCLVPYHLTQFYQASLLAEFAATSFLPLAFMFVERLTTENFGERKNLSKTLFNIAGLAAIYSLIIATHLPVTVIASYSLGVYALLLIDWKTNKKALMHCAAAVIIGLISSSWFWVKMVSELGWIQGGAMASAAHYDYRSNFVFSPFALVNLNNWYAGLIALLNVAILLPSIVVLHTIFRKKPTEKKPTAESSIEKNFRFQNEFLIKKRLRAAMIMAFVSLFMTTDLSRPFWAIAPMLKEVQFPYRWMAITSMLICPCVALSLQVWRDRITLKSFRPLHLPLLLAFAFAVVFTMQDLVFDSEYISRARFLQRIEEGRSGRSFSNWLPRGAKELKDLSPLDGNVDAGERKVSVNYWQTYRRSFTISAGKESSARVRSYFYPLWQGFILIGNQRIPVDVNQNTDGTLSVAVPPEEATMEIVFTEPPLTQISFVIAIFGWITIFALLTTGLFKKFQRFNV